MDTWIDNFIFCYAHFLAGVRNAIEVATQLAKESRKGVLPLGRTPPVCGTNLETFTLVIYWVVT